MPLEGIRRRRDAKIHLYRRHDARPYKLIRRGAKRTVCGLRISWSYMGQSTHAAYKVDCGNCLRIHGGRPK